LQKPPLPGGDVGQLGFGHVPPPEQYQTPPEQVQSPPHWPGPPGYGQLSLSASAVHGCPVKGGYVGHTGIPPLLDPLLPPLDPPELPPELPELPPELPPLDPSLAPPLPPPLLPELPLDNEDVPSLPPSLFSLLLVEPPQLAEKPMATTVATRPKSARFIARPPMSLAGQIVWLVPARNGVRTLVGPVLLG